MLTSCVVLDKSLMLPVFTFGNWGTHTPISQCLAHGGFSQQSGGASHWEAQPQLGTRIGTIGQLALLWTRTAGLDVQRGRQAGQEIGWLAAMAWASCVALESWLLSLASLPSCSSCSR